MSLHVQASNINLRVTIFLVEIVFASTLTYWMRRTLRGQKETWRFFATILGYGAITALISAFVELHYSFDLRKLQLQSPQLLTHFGGSYETINIFSASTIEELAKYVAAVLAITNARHFYRLSSAIVYLILIGLGFSLMEDAIFFLNPATLAPYRLLSFFVHSGTSAVIGYYLGRFRFGQAKYWQLALAVLGAIVLHFSFNIATTLSDHFISFYITLAITVFISSRIIILFRRTVEEEYALERQIFQPDSTGVLLNVNQTKRTSGTTSKDSVRVL
jgi:RsiW-degrading membrane proteinase PrsW (M82 family)